jgi:phosphoglycerate dehydrogenase-like enzyme
MPAHSLVVGVVAQLDDAAKTALTCALSDYEVLWASPSEWNPRFSECEVVFGGLPADWVEKLPHLRWLQLESVGFEPYEAIAESITERGIVVTNLRGQFKHPVAESVLAGVLAMLRGIDQVVEARGNKTWAKSQIRESTDLLHGSEAIVLGNGAIGAQIRHLLEAFGCLVRTYGRATSSAELRDRMSLDAALHTARVVVSVLPSTPDTAMLFDRERISKMNRDTIFANAGRGDVVDECALVAALEAGALGGAVLDVTQEEPLPAGSALWTSARMILTQHTGGGYRAELLDKVERFLSNLRAWEADSELSNVVDWQKGY